MGSVCNAADMQHIFRRLRLYYGVFTNGKEYCLVILKDAVALHRVERTVVPFTEKLRSCCIALSPDGAACPEELAFRRAGAYVQSGVMMILLLLSVAINAVEGDYMLLVPLGVACVVPLMAFAMLWKKKDWSDRVLLLLNGTLMLLGGSLLLVKGAPNGGSLMWFILFPPMVMLSMGHKLGTLLFGVFYFFLCAVMATPLHSLLSEPVSQGIRLRFLLVMLGAFVFSWWAEFLRFHTLHALRQTSEFMEKEAHTDPLTRVGNRRAFERYFQEVGSKARRENGCFSLLLIDLDHFKSINDTHGHDTGDQVLIHLAQSMLSHTRPMEHVFRWGGEEFIALLPGVDAESAAGAAERLRRYVEQTPYRSGAQEIPATVSIGIYTGGGTGSLDDVIAVADHHLYAAKESGRNKVVDSTNCGPYCLV